MSSRLRHPSMGRRSAESKLTILASAADHSLAYFAPTDSTSKTVATSQFGCNVPEFEVLTGPLDQESPRSSPGGATTTPGATSVVSGVITLGPTATVSAMVSRRYPLLTPPSAPFNRRGSICGRFLCLTIRQPFADTRTQMRFAGSV